jgi:type II secretory pathway pseudopilin PulG
MRAVNRSRRDRCALSRPLASGGFTLIELAVVVLVITLLVGSILVPLTSQVQQRKLVETQRTLDDIRETLIGFAMVNGRLPRPATSATDGNERPADCANDTDCTGFLPWTTLGTQKADAYGKIIRYSVTPSFANAATPITLTSAPGRSVSTRQSVAPFGVVTMITSVPALIWSQGPERGGTSADGAAMPDDSTTNLDEKANGGATVTTVISRNPSESTTAPGGEFDDIVTWVPTGLLLNRMVTAGRLP